jgi:hypothetical protein
MERGLGGADGRDFLSTTGLDLKTGKLIVENLDTKEQLTFALPPGEVQMVDWSPDNAHVLIYVSTSPQQFVYSVSLVSLNDQIIQLISGKVQFSGTCNRPFLETLWGSNQQAVFISDAGDLFLIRTSSSQILTTQIPTSEIGKIYQMTPISWTDKEIFFMVYLRGFRGKRIYSFNSQTDELKQRLPPEPADFTQTEFFSSVKDGRIIYRDLIANLTTGEQQPIRHSLKEPYRFYSEEVVWHPAGEWALVLTEPFEAIYPVYAVHVDGATRELTRCRLSQAASCFGWLPT